MWLYVLAVDFHMLSVSTPALQLVHMFHHYDSYDNDYDYEYCYYYYYSLRVSK